MPRPPAALSEDLCSQSHFWITADVFGCRALTESQCSQGLNCSTPCRDACCYSRLQTHTLVTVFWLFNSDLKACCQRMCVWGGHFAYGVTESKNCHLDCSQCFQFTFWLSSALLSVQILRGMTLSVLPSQIACLRHTTSWGKFLSENCTWFKASLQTRVSGQVAG